MRTAAVVFLAAAVFAVGAVAGFVRLGSSQPAPPAIVLGTASAPAGPPARDRAVLRPDRSEVGQTVEDATMQRYDARRAGGRRP